MLKIVRTPFLLILILLSACNGPRVLRIGGFEYTYSESQGRAFDAASREAEHLPKAFDIDSIYTEGAVLRNDLIMELLSERGLEFIETQIRRATSKQYEGYGSLGMSSMDGELGLNIGRQAMDKAYARIELSESSDPQCIPKELLPESMRLRLDYPPFLPNTCIAVTFIDRPTARYHLIYEDRHEWKPPFGYWTLIEAGSGKRLGSTTTADSAKNPQNGNTGHSFLTWRIRRLPGTFSAGPRLVTIRNISVAAPSPLAEGTKVVNAARVEKVALTVDEYLKVFNLGNTRSGWSNAVSDAGASRWGYDGYGLLDWKSRTLTRLTPQLRHVYGATASAEGFFVISNWWDYKTKYATLDRYDSNGVHQWGVQVAPPLLESVGSCGGGQSSVGSTKDYVVLYGRCGSGTEVLMLEISRKDLPTY